MDHAKKMILIEPEVIEKLKNNINNTNTNNLSRLDEEMHKVLSKKLEDREKWSLYLQTLQRYLYFVRKDKKPFEIPIISFEESESNKSGVNAEPITDFNLTLPKKDEKNHDFYTKTQLLQMLPKSYATKGELLLNILLNNKDKVHWDQQGVVFINNKEILKSNIVDLLNDVIRPLKNSSPRGWEEFATVLKEIQVPLTYIGNRKRVNFINDIISTTPDPLQKPINTETPEYSTPEYSTPQTERTKSGNKTKRKIDWERWNPY